MAAARLKTTKSGHAYYEIRYRVNREAPELSTRWYVPAGWSEKVVQRELAKQKAEFERQCRSGEFLPLHAKKELAAQQAARQAAEAAKIVTVKQYGERGFMPGKLAGTIGQKALSENSRAYYQNALDKHIYPVLGSRKMQEVTRAEPMYPTSPTRYFKKFGEKYGVENFHPHKLRHTFASIAITHNADVASVSEKLGHANKSITLQMYTHANAKSIKAAGDIVRDALKEKTEDSKQA